MRMTAKLKDILAKANNIASAKGLDRITDADFIARVEAICLVHHINWVLSLDNVSLLAKMRKFYPQFLRRIDSKENTGKAVSLIKALHRFIYGFISIKNPIGPDRWKETLAKYESEIPQISENLVADISEIELKSVNLQSLSDEKLYEWCDGMNEWSPKELKRRSTNSQLMQVAYLRTLLAKELEHIREAEDERLLKTQLKELNEEIIPDFLNVRITSTMSVSTLNALQLIYTLRSDLAFESSDFNEPTYANLQCHRLHQISKALKIKYRGSKSLDEKIEILELIENIAQILCCNPSNFALENVANLLDNFNSELTEFQRLRLKWLPSIDATDCDALIADLLPKVQSSFDITTILLVMDFCNEDIRKAIVEKFKETFAKALSGKDETELSTLLSYAAIWNVHPTLCPLLVELESQVSNLPLPLPVKRVNAIAADVYTKIDKITDKCNEVNNLSA